MWRAPGTGRTLVSLQWDSAVFELEPSNSNSRLLNVIVDRWGSGGRSRSEVVDASGAVLKVPEVGVIFVDSVQEKISFEGRRSIKFTEGLQVEPLD